MRIISSTNKSAEIQNGVKTNGGFTVHQWMLLAFAFFLGIASVMTVDKIFINNSGHAGAVHAGVVFDNEANQPANK
jgi:hypothetical protein